MVQDSRFVEYLETHVIPSYHRVLPHVKQLEMQLNIITKIAYKCPISNGHYSFNKHMIHIDQDLRSIITTKIIVCAPLQQESMSILIKPKSYTTWSQITWTTPKHKIHHHVVHSIHPSMPANTKQPHLHLYKKMPIPSHHLSQITNSE